jgi:hypothetical protein
MTADTFSIAVGQSFLDREGQRWWIKSTRPGSRDQFIVEAEVKASYPRVDLYVMTEQEFRARAADRGLRREERRQRGERPGVH